MRKMNLMNLYSYFITIFNMGISRIHGFNLKAHFDFMFSRVKVLQKDVKGQMRVIETIVAILIILSAFAFIYFFIVPPSSPTYETDELEKVGYIALHNLDEQGILGRLVYDEEWIKIADTLMVSLPSDVYFNLTVYDPDNNIVNSLPIYYGDPLVFRTSGSVASVAYGIPGYQTNYEPRVLILQLVER